MFAQFKAGRINVFLTKGTEKKIVQPSFVKPFLEIVLLVVTCL